MLFIERNTAASTYLASSLGLHLVLKGVQEKQCFFANHCNPSLADIAVSDFQSSQRNASVKPLLLAGNFLYNQQQPSTGEGEVANFREFLGKNTIFNEHPVPHECQGGRLTAYLKPQPTDENIDDQERKGEVDPRQETDKQRQEDHS